MQSVAYYMQSYYSCITITLHKVYFDAYHSYILYELKNLQAKITIVHKLTTKHTLHNSVKPSVIQNIDC